VSALAEVEFLEDLDLDETPPCTIQVAIPGKRERVTCGLPSVARVRVTCGVCGYTRPNFICADCLLMLKAGWFMCNAVKGCGTPGRITWSSM
jgi:hypothetical protein